MATMLPPLTRPRHLAGDDVTWLGPVNISLVAMRVAKRSMDALAMAAESDIKDEVLNVSTSKTYSTNRLVELWVEM